LVKNEAQLLYDYLLPYVTANKLGKFEQMLSQRTRALTVVLEDIFKPHNASAVLRTVECMGIQDVHIVEDKNRFNPSTYVMRGSGKWLTIYHHQMKPGIQNIETCIQGLKKTGYQIWATTPHTSAVDYSELDIRQKTAVVFGAEETGISQYVLDHADQLVRIPMRGFTESFNISVSAGIILEKYGQQVRNNLDWQLLPDEAAHLKLKWMQSVVPNISAHLRQFNKIQSQRLPI